MTAHMSDPVSRAWAHGVVSVNPLGAMIGPTSFLLPSGRQVSPLHVPGWANDPEIQAQGGLIAGLRGEWPCVPFGYPVPQETVDASWHDVVIDDDEVTHVHGYSSNVDWTLVAADDGELRFSVDYPEDEAISQLVRSIRPDPSAPALDIDLEVHARTDADVPIALHACFALPVATGGAVMEPGKFDTGLTHPGVVEPGAQLFEPVRQFDDLTRVPALSGGTVDAARLPFAENVEELLQLNGVDGTFALRNDAQGYRVRLTWDASVLPSVLLWYSNRGRTAAPWNGRHTCIGIEPCASPFGLSPQTATRANPIARAGTSTSVAITPAAPLRTSYRIAVEEI